jgi:hypothetical protein
LLQEIEKLEHDGKLEELDRRPVHDFSHARNWTSTLRDYHTGNTDTESAGDSE